MVSPLHCKPLPHAVDMPNAIVAIRSVHNNGYLDSRAQGLPVKAALKSPLDNAYRQWVLEDVGSGQVAIKSVHLLGNLDSGEYQ